MNDKARSIIGLNEEELDFKTMLTCFYNITKQMRKLLDNPLLKSKKVEWRTWCLIGSKIYRGGTSNWDIHYMESEVYVLTYPQKTSADGLTYQECSKKGERRVVAI